MIQSVQEVYLFGAIPTATNLLFIRERYIVVINEIVEA